MIARRATGPKNGTMVRAFGAWARRLDCAAAVFGTLLVGLAPAPSVAQVFDTATTATAASTQYLHPGDEIRLRIWREPDLSGDFMVDLQGVVVLPKIGPTHVSGEAVDSVKRRLISEYSRYLVDPSIEVTFLRRIRVLGAVRNPGLYPVDPTMSIRDALALAGGPTPDGSQTKLTLMRDGVKVQKLTIDERLADVHVRSGDQIVVPQRSWVSRNPGIVATMITATVTLFLALRR